MSAIERITGADWMTWCYHFWFVAIKGAADSVKATRALTVGAAVATEWIDLRVILCAAAAGFVLAVVDFFATTPLPTGGEVEETPPSAP